MRIPIPQTEEELREWLQALAALLIDQLPRRTGFVVLIYNGPFEQALNYVSNSNRGDVVRAMREFITMTEGAWGEHIPESDKDPEIAQLRQRVAVLEGQRERLFDSGFVYGRRTDLNLGESWETYLEGIGDQ